MGTKKQGEHGEVEDGAAIARLAIEGLQQLYKPTPETESKPVPVARTKRAIKCPPAAARVASYIDRHALTQIGFAEMAHIDERTLRRLLHSGSASSQTWAEVAKVMKTPPAKLLK